MSDLEGKTLILINFLLHKDEAEVSAVLKAKKLETSLDYLLLVVGKRLEEKRQDFELIFAFNPQQSKSFVVDQLRSTGYPYLLQVLTTMKRASDIVAKKRIYWSKVNDLFEFQKASFEKTFNGSSNKIRLLTSEITRYETLFFTESLRLERLSNVDFPVEGLGYHSIQINNFRNLYKQLIVNGKRDYSLTSLPDSGLFVTGAADSSHVAVEALSKYLEWLKAFQSNSEWSTDELYNQIIQGVGTFPLTPDDSEILQHIDKKVLDGYLAKYYKVSEEVKSLRSIEKVVRSLKGLVLHFKGKAGTSKTLDDWISLKILGPTTDRIERLEDLQSILVEETPRQKRKTSESGFDSFLTSKGRKVLPYLTTQYTEQKPQIIAFMLFALENLGYLVAGTLNRNQIALHAALRLTFGKVGTRQALNRNITNLRNPDTYHRDQISIHKKEILAAQIQK